MRITRKRQSVVVKHLIGTKEDYEKKEIDEEEAMKLGLMDDWVQHKADHPKWEEENQHLIRDWMQSGQKLNRKEVRKTDEMSKAISKEGQNENESHKTGWYSLIFPCLSVEPEKE